MAEDSITIALTLKDHKFEPAEVKAAAGKPIVITVKNQDATAEEFESHELKVEKVVAPNSEITIKIKPQKAGVYKFVGEYNEKTAQGVLRVE
jgi:plastocyanin